MAVAYVTIHDQDLLLECERSGRFADLTHGYIFVGPRPVDRLDATGNVIVAREWKPNYEHLPSFYDFTGWSILASPGIVRAHHIVLLQDDMEVRHRSLDRLVTGLLDEGPGPVAFTAGHRSAGDWMLPVEGFADRFAAGMERQGIDPAAFPAFDEWPSTQGTAWRTADFSAFMTWFEPLFDVWADDVWAGHLAERSMWAWSMSVGYPCRVLPGVISHEALDRHGTGALIRGRRDVYAERAATFGR